MFGVKAVARVKTEEKMDSALCPPASLANTAGSTEFGATDDRRAVQRPSLAIDKIRRLVHIDEFDELRKNQHQKSAELVCKRLSIEETNES